MSWFRSFADRYIHNADLKRNQREVDEVLATGKQREANALHRVAEATGDPHQAWQAAEAAREARVRRKALVDDVAMDVFEEDR